MQPRTRWARRVRRAALVAAAGALCLPATAGATAAADVTDFVVSESTGGGEAITHALPPQPAVVVPDPNDVIERPRAMAIAVAPRPVVDPDLGLDIDDATDEGAKLVAPNTCDYWDWHIDYTDSDSSGSAWTAERKVKVGKALELNSVSYAGVNEFNGGGEESATSFYQSGNAVTTVDDEFVKVDIEYPWSVYGAMHAGSHYGPATIISWLPGVDSRSTSTADYKVEIGASENSLEARRVVSTGEVKGTNGWGGDARTVNESWRNFGVAPPELTLSFRAYNYYTSFMALHTSVHLDPVPGAATTVNSEFYPQDVQGKSRLDYNRWKFTLRDGYTVGSCG